MAAILYGGIAYTVIVSLQGGQSTHDEMCLSFLAYYPRVDLSVCISQPIVPGSYSTFADQHIK